MRGSGCSIFRVVVAAGCALLLCTQAWAAGADTAPKASAPAANGAKADAEKVVTPDSLVTDLEKAISKKYTYTARGILAELERLSPQDSRIPDLREKVAALPEPEESVAIDLGGGVKMELILIKPGTFKMGSLKGPSSERPVHSVTIDKPFYLGKYEVTQDQWQAVIGLDPIETMARGIVARMKEATAAGADSITAETIEKMVSDQWEAVMSGANPKAVPPIKILSKAVADQWKSLIDTDPESIPTETMAKALAERWKLTGVEAMAEATVGLLRSKMGAGSGSLPAGTIKEAVAEEWIATMGADPIEAMASGVVDHLKAAKGAGTKPAPIKTIKKTVVDQWTAVMGADPTEVVPIDAMAKIVAEQWKALSGTDPKAIPGDKIAAAVAAQWRTVAGADPLEAMTSIVADEWKTASGADPMSVPVEKIALAVGTRWKALTSADPIEMPARRVADDWKALGSDNSRFKGANLPVDTVNWRDCQEYAKRLSCVFPGKVFRLPTEAEWEYACRAGSTSDYSFGDDEKALGDYAWFIGNSDLKSHPVGEKKPNPWGLYDMHGNLLEWCLSPLKSYPFKDVGEGGKTARTDPHVVRGGFWGRDFDNCRSAFRIGYAASNRHFSFGCRIALSVEP